MSLLQLFFSFFQIGLFSFGGGMAAIPLIQEQVVDLHNWLSLTEFTDLVTIAEMTPGPIAVNASTFVGIRIAGLTGAFVATFACILPSCMITFLLAWLYFKYQNLAWIQGTLSGLRPAIVALIASAGVTIFCLAAFGGKAVPNAVSDVNWIGLALFAAAFAALRKWKPNPIYVMLGCGAAGGILYTIMGGIM
ncbi:MAG: chromate transporter [Lachnospiraceae bacterium]|nr:chromate transporter [Lachnospiraceae bacterium]